MRLVVMMMPGFSFSHRKGDLKDAYWVSTGTAFFSRFTGVVVMRVGFHFVCARRIYDKKCP